MDDFQPRHIPNHSDRGGRYAYDQQPAIGPWNLTALAHAMLPLMDRETAVAALDEYEPALLAEYGTRLRAELGLAEAREEDSDPVDAIFTALAANAVDFTRFWRLLGRFPEEDERANDPIRDLFVDTARGARGRIATASACGPKAASRPSGACGWMP